MHSEGVLHMSSKDTKDKVQGTELGEWRWEAYICLIAALLCLYAVYAEHGFDLTEWIRDEAFISALLFGCWFYLSDLRYRLCKEVRND